MLAKKEGRSWDVRSKPPVAAWLGGEHKLALHTHGRLRLLGFCGAGLFCLFGIIVDTATWPCIWRSSRREMEQSFVGWSTAVNRVTVLSLCLTLRSL